MSLPEIIETRIFSRQVKQYLEPETYRLLQLALALNPTQGAVIPGSGGLRKLRWSIDSKGKRSGIRIIYYWASRQGVIVLLYMFKKNERSDLTPEQLRMLKQIVEQEFKTK